MTVQDSLMYVPEATVLRMLFIFHHVCLDVFVSLCFVYVHLFMHIHQGKCRE